MTAPMAIFNFPTKNITFEFNSKNIESLGSGAAFIQRSINTHLSSILHIQYNVPLDVATEITSTFLHNFRRCPDNTDVPLDVWRQHLWNEALSHKYNYLAPELYNKWLELRYKYLDLKPDIIALLTRLRRTFNLAIITNGPTNAQWEKINRLQLNKYFDCILVSGDLPWEKPDPQIFYACCNHLGVKPSECVMIGDKLETDIQGANVAHIGCSIWMPLNGDATNTTHIIPDLTVFDLNGLLHILPITSDICGLGTVSTTTMTTPTSTTPTTTSTLLTTTLLTVTTRKSGCGGSNRRGVPHTSTLRSLPDLENGNSHGSWTDGS